MDVYEMNFEEPWDLGDITFLIDDKKVFANKGTLQMSSPVFKKMFTADFSEKGMAEIPLPTKDFQSFIELMKVLHPPNTDIDGNNIHQILPLAHEYQMLHVIKRCEKQLLTEPPGVKNLVLADLYSLTELHKVCVQYAQNVPLPELERKEDFEKLEAETLVEILRYKVMELMPKEPTEPAAAPVQEPTKEFICELMSKPPSVDSLVLADLYRLPQLRNTCIEYAIDTDLSVLKKNKSFAKICDDTIKMILNAKVERFEPALKVAINEKKVLLKDTISKEKVATATQKALESRLSSMTSAKNEIEHKYSYLVQTLKSISDMKKECVSKREYIYCNLDNPKYVKHETGAQPKNCTKCQETIKNQVHDVCVPLRETYPWLEDLSYPGFP